MGKSDFNSMDNLLAGFVAGSLPEPVRQLVGAHLELKDENRAFVAGLEAMAGEAVDAHSEVALNERDTRLAAIFADGALESEAIKSRRGSDVPGALHALIPYELSDIPWRSKMPGYKECSLGVVDGCDVNLLWIRPGRKMPSHTHEGSEITLVLDGAFADANGRYGRGDVALADEDVDHRPIAEDDRPCICLAITDAPLRLTGSYSQILAGFIGR